ncbi:MAG: response regulator [Treponema sp.]|jgi:response regulator RpfG family c-di-GMP phosphodiesterase|nr:response regulator [Treponema sp.]
MTEDSEIRQAIDLAEAYSGVNRAGPTFPVDEASPSLLADSATDKKVILAIDDTPVSLSTIRSILKDEYDVRLSKNVEMAMQILNAVPVDLILLDIEMPDVSGFDFLRQIHAMPSMKKVPVIFVSGHKNVQVINDAFKIGANGYVIKPLSAQVLRQKVRAVMDAQLACGNESDVGAALRLGMKAPEVSSLISRLLQLKDSCALCKSEEIALLLAELQSQSFGAPLMREVDALNALAQNFDYDKVHDKTRELIEKLIK